MENLLEIMTSDWMMKVMLVLTVVVILLGLLMFIGIKYRGRVLLINHIFAKKQFDQEELLKKYTVQAVYTVVIGVILFALISFEPVARTTLWIILIVFAIFDGLYDYYAIKTSTKK